MKSPAYAVLIPVPVKVVPGTGKVLLSALTSVASVPEFSPLQTELIRIWNYLDLELVPVEKDGAVSLQKLLDASGDEWQLDVAENRVVLQAGSVSGMRYAIAALTQMMFAARIEGLQSDFLETVHIGDCPRFNWRGFHLDSARHFQSVGIVKKYIRMLAEFRINTFHWHLVDSEGWRYQSAVVSAPGAQGTVSFGQYSVDDLREVAAFAESLGVRIIPEVDVPGHSAMLLAHYPEYACDAADTGNELCIGNPATMDFLKRVFRELMDIFPASPIIHIGGDEAETAHWDACPVCRKAMQDKKLQNMRELENSFMVELSRFIVENRKTPMIWGTCSGQVYPPDTIIQVWLDIREPLRVAPNGNKIVYSVHNSLYFDYPANLSEPWETWMFELSERGVYMTDPHIIWADKVKDAILGIEACLWTETLPQWRVMRKLMPRLWAYSECAWSDSSRKNYADFVRRRELLEASGYVEYLYSL